MPLAVADLIALHKHDRVRRAVRNRPGNARFWKKDAGVGGVRRGRPGVERAWVPHLSRWVADVRWTEESCTENAVGPDLRIGALNDIRRHLPALGILGAVVDVLLLGLG